MPLSSKQRDDYVLEPALNGAALGVGSAMYFGADQLYGMGGSQYRLWPLAVALGVGGTMLMNYVNNTVNQHLPDQISIVTHPLETAVDIAGTSAVVLAAEQVISPGLAGDTMMPVIAGVAAAKIGSKFVVQSYLSPWWDSMIQG